MRILLDTHYLIWAINQPDRLPVAVSELLQDAAADICFSAASIWEIAIKYGLTRPDFQTSPIQVSEAARQIGFEPLPVTVKDAAAVSALPLHHRDPFDRLLVAQALNQPARLLTADPLLARYSELVWLQPV